jgi:Quinohemoprotein amine dehydrogenase A, alpha subunit, haem binding
MSFPFNSAFPEKHAYNCMVQTFIPGGIMRKTLLSIGILCITILVFAVACSSGTPTSTVAPAVTASQEGATLVSERCTVCHSLSRVESLRLSAADWSTVVDQMIARGAQLTPAEKTVIVNYLAANFGK